MAENRVATGTVSSTVALGLTSSHLESGKWDTSYPQTSLPVSAPGVTAFIARGRQGSATGTEGHVKYQAGDGTTFTLHSTFRTPRPTPEASARRAPRSATATWWTFPRAATTWRSSTRSS